MQSLILPSSLLKFDFWLFKGYAPIVNGTVDSQRVTSMDKLDDNNDKDSKKDINDNKMPTIKVRKSINFKTLWPIKTDFVELQFKWFVSTIGH